MEELMYSDLSLPSNSGTWTRKHVPALNFSKAFLAASGAAKLKGTLPVINCVGFPLTNKHRNFSASTDFPLEGKVYRINLGDRMRTTHDAYLAVWTFMFFNDSSGFSISLTQDIRWQSLAGFDRSWHLFEWRLCRAGAANPTRAVSRGCARKSNARVLHDLTLNTVEL